MRVAEKGQLFTKYRRSGGRKTSTLPDFVNGAHAAVADFELLTREASRYGTYFPTVQFRTPS